jgi:hypothetical protein
MKIPIKLISLSAENPTEVRDANITLEKTYLRLFLDYDSETLINPEDPIIGWNDFTRKYFDIYVKKSSISSIERFWNKEDMWQIGIIVAGGDDLKLLYSPKDPEVDLVFQKLLTWWLE